MITAICRGLLGIAKIMNIAANYVLNNLTSSPKHEIKRIMEISYNRGWISSRDGNASVVKNNTFYITPSGVTKYNIDVKDIVTSEIDITELGERIINISSGSTPSGELALHLNMYKSKNVMAVLHLHPTNTISAMEAGFDLRYISSILQELSRFTKVGPNVSKLPVTSQILAEETLKAMSDESGIVFDIVGQAGHGVTAVGIDLNECFQHIERLEHACEIVLKSGIKPPVSK